MYCGVKCPSEWARIDEAVMKIMLRNALLLLLCLPVSVLADTASALANAPSITAQELYAAQNKGLSLYGSKEYQEASPH